MKTEPKLEKKTRRELYNNTLDKLKRFNEGELYLSSILSLDAKEEWFSKESLIADLQKDIESVAEAGAESDYDRGYLICLENQLEFIRGAK